MPKLMLVFTVKIFNFKQKGGFISLLQRGPLKSKIVLFFFSLAVKLKDRRSRSFVSNTNEQILFKL